MLVTIGTTFNASTRMDNERLWHAESAYTRMTENTDRRSYIRRITLPFRKYALANTIYGAI